MLEIKYINFIDYHAPTTVKYHVHDCYELVYYHSGSGTVLYDEYNKQNVSRSIRASKLNSSDDFLKERILYLNKSHSETEKRDTFTANTYYIFPAELPHSEIHETTPSLTAIGFTTTDHEFKRVKYSDDFSTVHALLTRMRSEYVKKHYHFIEVIRHLLSIILIETERKDISNKEDPLEYAKNYIKQYYRTDIDLNNLSSVCGYCPDYFRMIFRQKYGIPPKQYILNNRLHFAKSQLSNTSLSIEEISSNCGFASYKQFSDFFKKKTGTSPTLYRAVSASAEKD